jgi:protein-tyrosine-phosphatase
MPEELVESIKERVDSRGVSGCIAAAAAHQDAMDRLRELAERLEEGHGAVTDEEQRAALDRIAAIDDWHDEQQPHPARPREPHRPIEATPIATARLRVRLRGPLQDGPG